MKRSLCACFIMLLPTFSIAQGNLPEGGIRFSSYEVIKDLRTGINFTPNKPLEIGQVFKLEFDFAYWRSTEAYGHVFRLIGPDGNNIDLISSPYNSKFDDLNLILGDSTTALSFSFEEIAMTPGKWNHCTLILSKRDHSISLTINDIKKSKKVTLNLNDVFLVYGKNDLGQYTTSDVPPLKLKDVKISSNDELFRHWPLIKYNEFTSYDEIDYAPAKAINPHWIIDRHFKWLKSSSISTAHRPQIVYNGDSLIYLLTSELLVTYNINAKSVSRHVLEKSVSVPFNQTSLYKKDLNEIWCYDIDSLKINKFSIDTKSYYEVNSLFNSETFHWHSNKILTEDNLALFFGGYGFYSYTNDLILHSQDQWRVKALKKLDPRYLDAMGQDAKGNVFILGGYGSKKGNQEYGAHSYLDLYKIDVNTFTTEQIWEKDPEDSESSVFSNSMVFNDSDSMLYVLKYPRDKFNSKAVLQSFEIYSGNVNNYGDSLDINFLDTNSFVDLIRNKNNNKLMAVVMEKSEKSFQTTLYTLNFPPISREDIFQYKPINRLYYYALLLLAFVLIGVYVYVRREIPLKGEKIQTAGDTSEQEAEADQSEKENISPKTPTDPAPEFDDKKSAILFCGGFQVLDREGNDISEKFSQTLRTLLTMLLLFSSNRGKGVPSNFIWENLWGDKNQSSARNNRNVNIKKLRDILQNVGEIEIKSSSDKWKIYLNDEHLFFDYHYLLNCIEEHRQITPELISLIKRGNILPTLELDWTDSYKADFSNKIVDYLLEYSRSLSEKDPLQMEISNCIFQHDIINQDALFIKIKHLNATKKFALAKQCYESYSKEYEILYGEPFDILFEEILKDTSAGSKTDD